MEKIKNRFVDALVKLILFSAITHLVLLLIYSIIHFDAIYLNYFNILDIDLFFPEIINGLLSQLLSIVAIIIIYLIIYINFTKKEK